jgi:hypothetical protein
MTSIARERHSADPSSSPRSPWTRATAAIGGDIVPVRGQPARRQPSHAVPAIRSASSNRPLSTNGVIRRAAE